jgi:hypothetical protein
MDNNRFFKFLWRLNAILVACALILAIGDFIDTKLNQPSRQTTDGSFNIATYRVDERGETVVEERWRYGRPDEVTGTSGSILPLYLVAGADEPAYQIKNLAFVDANLAGSRWLLPDHQRRILNYQLLRSKDHDRVLAVLYEIADQDAAQGENGISVYLSRPDGKELTQVITSLDRIIGHAMPDEQRLVIFYVKDGAGHSDMLAISDFSMLESIKLPHPETP